jgi:hypothetical protein
MDRDGPEPAGLDAPFPRFVAMAVAAVVIQRLIGAASH